MGPLHFVSSLLWEIRLPILHFCMNFMNFRMDFVRTNSAAGVSTVVKSVCSWCECSYFFFTRLMSPPMLSALAYLRRMPCPHHIQEKGHHTVVSS